MAAESKDPYCLGMLRLDSLRESAQHDHTNRRPPVLRFFSMPLMRSERIQAIGMIVVALIVLAVVLMRYGARLPWSAR